MLHPFWIARQDQQWQGLYYKSYFFFVISNLKSWFSRKSKILYLCIQNPFFPLKVFIGLSILVRIIEAIGNSGFLTASFSIIAKEFPDSVATMFACLETFFGMGLIAGPVNICFTRF